MEAVLQFILLLVAVAIGWLLGRYKLRSDSAAKDSRDYYRDLTFLFSEEPGPAVMSVIENLPVNESSLPTHLALGNLLRDKGEIEGATRIHQNLLKHAELPAPQLGQVHLELARDYISAGLLDRAEKLLRDLINEDEGALRREALEYLQHIFQSEREWENAIAVARQRLPKKTWFEPRRNDSAETRSIKRSLSHYCCELAEAAYRQGDVHAGEAHLARSLQYQDDNIRALLQQSKQLLTNHPQRARAQLEKLMRSHSEFVVELLPLYRRTFSTDDSDGTYVAALEALVLDIDSSTLQLELIRELLSKENVDRAKLTLSELLAQRPTLNLLGGVNTLPVDIVEPNVVREAMSSLRAGRPTYRCKHCGFSGKKQHWLCPGCEQWGTIAPIHGSEGD